MFIRTRLQSSFGHPNGFGIVRRCVVNRGVEYGKYPRAFELWGTLWALPVLELHASTTPYARDAYDQAPTKKPGNLYLPKLRLLRQLIRPANSGGEPANAAGRGWGGRRPLAGARGSSARHAVQRDRLEAEAVAG